MELLKEWEAWYIIFGMIFCPLNWYFVYRNWTQMKSIWIELNHGCNALVIAIHAMQVLLALTICWPVIYIKVIAFDTKELYKMEREG